MNKQETLRHLRKVVLAMRTTAEDMEANLNKGHLEDLWIDMFEGWTNGKEVEHNYTHLDPSTLLSLATNGYGLNTIEIDINEVEDLGKRVLADIKEALPNFEERVAELEKELGE